MPNIKVTCPACKSGLEIDAEYEGQEIECGSCLKVFVAKADKPDSDAAGRSGSGNRSRRSNADSDRGRSSRSSRRRDDDDDDDDDDRPRRSSGAGQNPLAVASLVLGILSVLLVVMMLPMACIAGCCCAPLAWLPLPVTVPLSLAAIITGALGLRNPNYKAMAIIGIVLGVLCLAVAILQLAFGFLPFLAVPAAPPPRVR